MPRRCYNKDMNNNEKICAWDENDNMIVFDSRDEAEKAGFSFEDTMPLVEVEEIVLDGDLNMDLL